MPHNSWSHQTISHFGMILKGCCFVRKSFYLDMWSIRQTSEQYSPDINVEVWQPFWSNFFSSLRDILFLVKCLSCWPSRCLCGTYKGFGCLFVILSWSGPFHNEIPYMLSKPFGVTDLYLGMIKRCIWSWLISSWSSLIKRCMYTTTFEHECDWLMYCHMHHYKKRVYKRMQTDICKKYKIPTIVFQKKMWHDL